ncbi:MAG: zf-HC2 domain-containing protein [Gemmatimonadaceae bacterium]
MSEIRLHIADDDLPQHAETREARHELLASFLAAYADGELPPETQSQLDSHLAGCARCRRELNVHRTLRDRLEREPVPAAIAALRERIAIGIRSIPAPVFPPKETASPVPKRTPSRWLVAAAIAFFVAVPLVGSRTWQRFHQASSAISVAPHSVQLFDTVFADYRRVSGGDLPGRARDLAAVRAAVPFAVTPLSNPDVRLIAAWTTTLSGTATAVLAYRWNERVVLQYLIPEELLFQSSSVRTLLTQTKAVAAAEGTQNLLLWANPESGSVLVGDVSARALTEMHASIGGR